MKTLLRTNSTALPAPSASPPRWERAAASNPHSSIGFHSIETPEARDDAKCGEMRDQTRPVPGASSFRCQTRVRSERLPTEKGGFAKSRRMKNPLVRDASYSCAGVQHSPESSILLGFNIPKLDIFRRCLLYLTCQSISDPTHLHSGPFRAAVATKAYSLRIARELYGQSASCLRPPRAVDRNGRDVAAFQWMRLRREEEVFSP